MRVWDIILLFVREKEKLYRKGTAQTVEKNMFLKQTSNSLSLSPLGHSDGFASCKAWCVLISASLPKTPFPRKGAILLGLPPLVQARMLAVSRTKPLHDAVAQMADDLYRGYAPATPFSKKYEFIDSLSAVKKTALCFFTIK